MEQSNNTDPVDQLRQYIEGSLKSGVTPNEVQAQLQKSGWPQTTIDQAFAAHQNQVIPTTQPSLPPRGRIKTGWILFKESWQIIRNDETIFRFVIMSAIFSFIFFVIYLVALIAGHNIFTVKTTVYNGSSNSSQYSLTPLGLLITVIYYIIAYFVVNLYTAGLVANVLDRFKGQKQAYRVYMKLAWSKAGKLFVFSTIEATIGLLLRLIAERSRILGRIVASLLGFVWSIVRLFVVPIIVDQDESPIPAIKDSTKLLIATWGENIVGRVSMSGALFLIALLIMLPVAIVLFFVGALIAGVYGAIGAGAIVVLMFLVFVVISNAAESVLNVSLYYYAKYNQLPPVYSPELLNSVFIHKNSKNKLLNKL